MKKYKDLYQQGQQCLTEAGVPEPGLDARYLLEYVCHTSLNDLYVHGDREVDEKLVSQYEALIAKRMQRIPYQHLIGCQEFMGLSFQVSPDVLIPRQDTEILVEEVLKHLHDGMRILDMCTGSGCILLSLLKYSNVCTGVGADISAKALQVARQNLEKIFPEESREWAEGSEAFCSFVESNLFEKVEGKFDILVSNPPYIPTAVIAELEPEVKDHEPMGALDGKEDGLFFYRRIITEGKEYLWPGGLMALEIGCEQTVRVSELLQEAGYSEIVVHQDYAGLDRVVSARR